jgi:hypothetical protein
MIAAMMLWVTSQPFHMTSRFICELFLFLFFIVITRQDPAVWNSREKPSELTGNAVKAARRVVR